MPSTATGRRVGFWLSLGITFFPYFFVWALFAPGYSRVARIVGFGWLVIIVIWFGSLGLADRHASTYAKEFCSRFAVGESFQQAVTAALSNATAYKRQSKGENGEDILYVSGDAEPFFSARIFCVIEGREGKIINVDFLSVGVD
jgi:hypothetical protein